jgi:hypothetical protein
MYNLKTNLPTIGYGTEWKCKCKEEMILTKLQLRLWQNELHISVQIPIAGL